VGAKEDAACLSYVLSVDVLAGLRLWRIETELDLDAGIAAARSVQDQDVWVDPILGARGSVPLWGPFWLSAAAVIGGFDAASELTWEVLGTIDVRRWERVTFRAGYRHVDVDYEDGGFIFDAALSGSIFAAVVHF